jgi:hypothetical protein
MTCFWVLTVVLSLNTIQPQQEGIEWKSVISQLIDDAYVSVSRDRRHEFAAELTALLDRHRNRLTTTQFNDLIEGMKAWGFWTRASTSALDYKSAGDPYFPEYPSTFIDREFTLLIEYHDTWITSLGNLSGRSQATVDDALRQYESLLSELRSRIGRAVSGPYANQYLDAYLRMLLTQMQKAGQDSSWMSIGNLLRPLTDYEVSALLQEVDRRIEKLKEPVLAEVPPLDANAATDFLNQDIDSNKSESVKRVWDTLHALGEPATFGDMKRYWAPKVHVVDTKIEGLRAEVRAWWRSAFRERAATVRAAHKDKDIQRNLAPADSDKHLDKRSDSPLTPFDSADTRKTATSSTPQSGKVTGLSWAIKLLLLTLAIVVVVGSIIVTIRKRPT